MHRAFSFGQPCASISCYNPLIPFFTIRSKSGFPSTFTRNGSFYKLSLSSNNVTIKIAFLSVIPPGPDLFFRKGNRKSLAEQIAPAQKSTETLEKEEVEDDETGENESSDAENQTAESEPETAEREQTEETEVLEAVYGTRKEYMDRLSEQGMAEYMADEYKSHRLLVTDLANIWNLRKWLSEKVDRFGKPMEDAR